MMMHKCSEDILLALASMFNAVTSTGLSGLDRTSVPSGDIPTQVPRSLRDLRAGQLRLSEAKAQYPWAANKKPSLLPQIPKAEVT